MERCRVLIADDRPRSRDALTSLLTTVPEVEVVGEAGDGQEAARLVEERDPDVILMDVQMPDVDGLEATRTIKERWPQVKVVVLTIYGSYRPDALAAGADAFVNKADPTEALLEAIAGVQRDKNTAVACAATLLDEQTSQIQTQKEGRDEEQINFASKLK